MRGRQCVAKAKEINPKKYINDKYYEEMSKTFSAEIEQEAIAEIEAHRNQGGVLN